MEREEEWGGGVGGDGSGVRGERQERKIRITVYSKQARSVAERESVICINTHTVQGVKGCVTLFTTLNHISVSRGFTISIINLL